LSGPGNWVDEVVQASRRAAQPQSVGQRIVL